MRILPLPLPLLLKNYIEFMPPQIIAFIALVIYTAIRVSIGIMMTAPPLGSLDRLPIPKKDPPPKPPIDDIPEQDPPNRIKPPPRRVIKDPPNDFPPPPPPPKRILPVSTDTAIDIRSVVKENLLDHAFGCLLARPFYEADQTLCEYENTTFAEFYDILQSDMETELDTINSEIVEGKKGHALRTAPAFVSIDSISQPLVIVGTKQLHKLSSYYAKRAYFANNFEVSGLISVGETMIQDCTIPVEYIDEPKFNYPEAECMIPMSAYDEMQGYKADQLQVIWRNHDWETQKRRRYFTIPQPKPIDNFTIDSLKAILPASMVFGATIIDIWLRVDNIDNSIRPLQKCVVTTDFKTADEIHTFVYEEFQKWVDAVCEGVTIKEYKALHLDGSKIYVGECSPYRAVYMGWDKEKQYWFKKADWYLAK